METDTPYWYAVQCKPRQEERAASNLRVGGIHAFLPCLRPCPSARRRRRGAASAEPLFTGYLFVRCDSVEVPKVRYTRGVSRVVSDRVGPIPVDAAIIETIQQRIDSDGFISPAPWVTVGDAVRITAGPLKELVGILERVTHSGRRVHILLTTILGQVRVVVDGRMTAQIVSHDEQMVRGVV